MKKSFLDIQEGLENFKKLGFKMLFKQLIEIITRKIEEKKGENKSI